MPPYILHCQICSKKATTLHCPSAPGVDPTLVSRFLGLLGHPDTAVVLAMVEALPTVVMHTNLTSAIVNQYLALLTHQDKGVVSALCQRLPILVCVKEQHPSQVCWNGQYVFAKF